MKRSWKNIIEVMMIVTMMTELLGLDVTLVGNSLQQESHM